MPGKNKTKKPKNITNDKKHLKEILKTNINKKTANYTVMKLGFLKGKFK